MQRTKIIEALKKLGFTEYESKVYISLLEKQPQNGNSLAQSSGVPSSKVYEVLRNMQEEGYVFLVTNSGSSTSKFYSPLPYSDLIRQKNQEFTANLDFAETAFEQLSKEATKVWTSLYNIEGYETTLELIDRSIVDAKKEVVMVGWIKELEPLLPALEKVHEKGVKIATVSFDSYQEELPWLHINHAPQERALKNHQGELSIVIDQELAILFDSEENPPNAVVSNYYPMTNAIRNYITHDIYLNKIQNDMPLELKERYGEDLNDLYESTI